MFEDQTVQLLPARTTMHHCHGGMMPSFVGGAGGPGGAGGAGGNGGIAIAINAGNINFGGTQTNTAMATANGGAGGAGGTGGAGGPGFGNFTFG